MAEKKSPFITTGETVRNFVGWAFLLSVLVHFLILPLLPNMKNHAEDQQVEQVSVQKKVKIKVPTPPPPTPTPPPTPPPHSTPPPKQAPVQPQLKMNVVKTTNTKGAPSTENSYVAPKNGTENGVPAGQGTASPVPGTPEPAKCAVPYKEATAVNSVPPDYPDSAKDLGLGEVTVLIKVTVGANNQLIDASVYQSGHNMAMDQSALRAARQTTYSAKIVNCVPVQDSYIFHADFSPDQ